jgi:hypothetical protein
MSKMQHSALFVLHIYSIWIHPIEKYYTLLIHREHNATTEYESCPSRDGPTPQFLRSFDPHKLSRTMYTIFVQHFGLDTLHSSFDCINWLCHIYRDETCRSTDSKC